MPNCWKRGTEKVNMVLPVIDAQRGITNEKLYNFEGFVNTVKTLIAHARQNHVEVILCATTTARGRS